MNPHNHFPQFADTLIAWQREHGRHDFPWQVRDPYAIWLSEIMLQQTQAATVRDYFVRFINALPNIQALANAPQDSVLALWAGLGYYSRARNLHFAAQQIMQQFGGQFPRQREQLQQLKGVGRSTAAAIAAFAFCQRETILDGNVKRILCRIFAQDGVPNQPAFERDLWALAEQLLPENASDMPAYTQGLMDLGATICTRSKPQCSRCPMQPNCLAHQQQRVHELPRKKTATAVRQQTLFWLIIQRNDGAIYLQKRPSKGIWAGLYGVLEASSLHDLQQLAATFALNETDWQEQAAFTHRLTHRLLEIVPYRATLPAEHSGISHAAGVWVLPEHAAEYAVPTPLADLLCDYFACQLSFKPTVLLNTGI